MNPVTQVRHFNRTITRRIGVLEDHFLGRSRSIGASRLLFEIGKTGIEIRKLRTRLGLDSGYTSRLLRSLESEGLVKTGKSTTDSRVHFAKLTSRGIKEVELLNKLSNQAAAHLLAPLSEKQKIAITDAMATVERLISVSALSIKIEDPQSEHAMYALKQYYAELQKRFDRGFNPKLSISAEPNELTPPNGFFLIAEIDGEPVGCGALKCHSDFGEIKRMWVSDSVRGLGIGKRILLKLEEIARQQKLPLLRLETNKSLSEAKALYASNGYKEVRAFNNEPYAHHWFEKKLN